MIVRLPHFCFGSSVASWPLDDCYDEWYPTGDQITARLNKYHAGELGPWSSTWSAVRKSVIISTRIIAVLTKHLLCVMFVIMVLLPLNSSFQEIWASRFVVYPPPPPVWKVMEGRGGDGNGGLRYGAAGGRANQGVPVGSPKTGILSWGDLPYPARKEPTPQ